MVTRVSLVAALLAVLAGCEPYDLPSGYTCDYPDKGHKGPDGEPDPCHYEDVDAGADGGPDAGGDAHAEPRCVAGEYAHWRVPWQQPTLLWIGAPDQAPECPLGPTSIVTPPRRACRTPPPPMAREREWRSSRCRRPVNDPHRRTVPAVAGR